MATTKSRPTSTRKSASSPRGSSAKRGATKRTGLLDNVRKQPYAGAAIATGAVAAVAAAAAGAFFFSRRDKGFSEASDELGEKLSGYSDRIKDGLSEAREKAGAFFSRNEERTQHDIAEEAETLKGTGDMLDAKAKRGTKAGAVGY